MGNVHVDISVSLDGFVAASGDSPDVPLGVGGEVLHDWVMNRTERDDEVVAASKVRTGAIVAGRRTYDNAYKWWGPGKGPAGDTPVVVVSHSVPDDPALDGSPFTFVTDGVESALKQAQDLAGDGDVCVMGGADVAQQFLRADLVDQLHLHLVPVLLGGGTRLFDVLDGTVPLRQERVSESEAATHLTYRVIR